MKLSPSTIPFALLVATGSASPLEGGHEKRAADNCLRAVRGTPSIGLPFCSSVLTILPVSSTEYVTAPAVTSVVSTTATESATLTQTTGTDTVTVTAAATVTVAKRRTDPTVNIFNQCGNVLSRVTSACSEFMSGVPTSTITILSTTTPTVVTTALATVTETQTVQTAALTTLVVQPPPPPPPRPLIVNDGFDETPPLKGWTALATTNCPSCQYAVVNGVESGVPSSRGFYAVLYPTVSNPDPATNGYVSVSQTLGLVPGKVYTFNVRYRTNTNVAGFPNRIEFLLRSGTDVVNGGVDPATGMTFKNLVFANYVAPQAPVTLELRLSNTGRVGTLGTMIVDYVHVEEQV